MLRRHLQPLAALILFSALLSAQPIPIKVVVVTMFEPGADIGDRPGEFQLWVEREPLDQVIPFPQGYRNLRMNRAGILAMVTGVGTAKAAASVMALGMDPRFDLSKAYWLVAGIGGGDPADVSLGSAVWCEHAIDGDLAYELDAREIPKDWPTGIVPLRKATPYEQPVKRELEGEIYTLNAQLAGWAWLLTRDTPLADNPQMKTARARYAEFPNALRSPFVTHGDTISSSTFWHGRLMNQWANNWVKYFTAGAGNYMVSAMEDTGTMQALTFLAAAGKADIARVLILRTVSNYDREPSGSTPADDLASIVKGSYSAYLPALDAAQKIGHVVVRYLVDHWSECRDHVPGSQARVAR